MRLVVLGLLGILVAVGLVALFGGRRPDDKPEPAHDASDTTAPTSSPDWPKLPKPRRPKPAIKIPPPIR